MAVTTRLSLLLAVIVGFTPPADAQVPARIVSTSPSIPETLFALGLGDRVVGVSRFCRFPPARALSGVARGGFQIVHYLSI